ncbi:TrbC family F-type conjugative pilus assembly protein [Azomonas macrocytogenes]|uniref:Conjugal transfer pilus assembly protein TraW n=1 Tax=Azomonas macrocytogenes TaxID=69962 RepID=A0A839T6P5_AZOMA|nr:TrbC family F-type conjugative pilus assembly protein [Azomonas macrocytogenes]MBB3105177.1 conjugal transfer pilus assembly protein TraW [Azomonas macrocytogenes]
MSRSLAEPTPCSRWLVALLLAGCTGVANAEFLLSSPDMALIQQVQAIQANPAAQLGEDWMKRAQQNAATGEAKALLHQLQAEHPLMREMQQHQADKVAEPAYSTLVFVSYSLGEQGLSEILSAVSGQPEMAVVLRGIPEGTTLGEGLLAIQKLAMTQKPVPNIILDPVLFRQYGVTHVPTLVSRVRPGTDEQGPLPVIARVQGIAEPQWLQREIAKGKEGDLGVRGPLQAIAEPDLIEVMQARAAAIDWEQKKDNAKKRFWSLQTFHELPRASQDRTRRMDPSVVVTQDIQTSDGQFVAHAGDRVNPLDSRPFTQAVVVFDPLDAQQVKQVLRSVPHLKQEPGVQRITYLVTRVDKADGWTSYQSITDALDAPVYLLTPDVKARFELESVPSIITAQDNQFVIRELGPRLRGVGEP